MIEEAIVTGAIALGITASGVLFIYMLITEVVEWIGKE
jgi:hypothetical protein